MSRFASIPRAAAACVLVALAAIIAFGLWPSGRSAPARPAAAASDLALYRAIIHRVRMGEPYEASAVAEQRARNYPLKPFVVVRPPALAMALSRLPDERTGDWLLALLGAGVIAAWGFRLHSQQPHLLALAGMILIVATGVGATMAGGGASLLHECWAGLLIALSLALRTEKRFVAAVALGLLAALIRELALPYLVVMTVAALAERRRAEATAFSVALGIASASLGLHAHAVMALAGAQGPASASWLALGGWPFVLQMAKWNLLAVLAGAWTVAAIVPLSLVGAAGWKSSAGLRLTTLLLGYTLGFMAIGRPENDYWGLLITPLTAVGLSQAPAALSDLIRRAAGIRREAAAPGLPGADAPAP